MAESGVFPYTFICFTVQSLQSPPSVNHSFMFSPSLSVLSIMVSDFVILSGFFALFLSCISKHPVQNSISNVSSLVISNFCIDDFAFVLEEDMHSILKMILLKKLIFTKEFCHGLYKSLEQITIVET